MVTEQLTEAQRQAVLAQIPVGRFCEPEEFAHVVRFLVVAAVGIHHRRNRRPERRRHHGLTNETLRPQGQDGLHSRRLRRHRRGDQPRPGGGRRESGDRRPGRKESRVRWRGRSAAARAASRWTSRTCGRSATRSTASAGSTSSSIASASRSNRRSTEVTEEAYDRVYRTNLKSAMFLAQAVAKKQIAAKRGGKQVHLLSVRAQLGLRGRGYSAYCSTKGGLVMLIKQHASELGKHGICVNGVAPTVVRTEMGAHWLKDPKTARLAEGAHSARPRRRAGGLRRRHPVLLLGRGRLRHRPDPLPRRRHHRIAVAARACAAAARISAATNEREQTAWATNCRPWTRSGPRPSIWA